MRGDRARPGDGGPFDDGRRPRSVATRPRWPSASSGCSRRSATEIDDGEAWLEERRERWITGTPDQAREKVRRFAEAGVERIMLQDFLPWDLDMIDVMGEALVGQV